MEQEDKNGPGSASHQGLTGHSPALARLYSLSGCVPAEPDSASPDKTRCSRNCCPRNCWNCWFVWGSFHSAHPTVLPNIRN
jgi:hypothetical protein